MWKTVFLSGCVIGGLFVGYYGPLASVSDALSHAGDLASSLKRTACADTHAATVNPELTRLTFQDTPKALTKSSEAPILYLPDQYIYAAAPVHHTPHATKKAVPSRHWVCEAMHENDVGGRSALCLPTN